MREHCRDGVPTTKKGNGERTEVCCVTEMCEHVMRGITTCQFLWFSAVRLRNRQHAHKITIKSSLPALRLTTLRNQLAEASVELREHLRNERCDKIGASITYDSTERAVSG